MRFQHELRYDASPEEVYAMLSQAAFREQVCEAQRVTDFTVEIDAADGSMSVRVDQHRPSDGFPTFAKKFVGDEIHIVQNEGWSSPTDAELDVGIPGKPGHLKGTVALRPEGGGTLETVAGELKVAIPMVGGKIEKLVSDLLTSALEAEQRVGRAWLDKG